MCPWNVPSAVAHVSVAINEALKERRGAGIEIPFPQRDLALYLE